MSEVRYHVTFWLGVRLRRLGQRLVDAADGDPCNCEVARCLALVEGHGMSTRGPRPPWIVVAPNSTNTASNTITFMRTIQ